MDPKTRFGDAADDYAKYRPDYPDDLVRACAEHAALPPGATVVDVGCGTGISTRRFARHGFALVGVDPSAPMLAKAIEAGGASYVQGEAAATGLRNACADMVIVAQALHWFEMDDCVPEWRRILRPPFHCAAFWNYRSDEGWQSEYEDLLKRYSHEYPVVQKATGKGDDNSHWIKRSPLCTDVAERELKNSQRMDWNALLGRANSSSYVIHGIEDRPGFERDLRRLFDIHAADGVVEFRYRTYLVLFRLA